MARFWAGRIAVTEHIPGLLAYEPRTRARGRQKGGHVPTRAWLLGGPLGRIMAVTGDRLVASRTVWERPGLYGPLGGVEQPRRRVRFRVIDPWTYPRCWRTCGPQGLRRESMPTASPRTAIPQPSGRH